MDTNDATDDSENFYFIAREIAPGPKNSGAVFDYFFDQRLGFGIDSIDFVNFFIQATMVDSDGNDSVKAAEAFFKNFNYLTL